MLLKPPLGEYGARFSAALGAQVHLAARTVDERPDGAWHAEWQPFRELLRTAGGAAATGRELADGLRVHADAIAADVAAHTGDLLAESAKYGGAGTPADYLGEADTLTTRLIVAAEQELA